MKKRDTKKKETAVKQVVLDSKDKEEDEGKEKIREKEGIFAARDVHRILASPHFTEKSAILGERGAYVFKVKPEANKVMIKNAVSRLYGVTVRRVNISIAPSKRKFIRGKWGVKSGYKKATVYLKEGERIEI